MNPWLKRIGALCLVIIFMVLGIVMTWTLFRVRDESHNTKSEFELNTIAGRIGACTSSTELRNLLNDIGDIVAPVDSINTLSPKDKAVALAFRDRIEQFTSHNPNCALLTPAQRRAALTVTTTTTTKGK